MPFTMLSIFSEIGDTIDHLPDLIMYGLYWVIWLIIKGVSTIITIVEKAFFLFAGVNAIKFTDSQGTVRIGYIINAFLGNAKVFSAYLQLSVIAFIVMLVLAVLKIVKQDYLDKEGPRSKGPIFRNLVISFILYIAIPPLFMIMSSVSSVLTMAVYKALGGGGDLIADVLLKNSFGFIGENHATFKPYEALYGGISSYVDIPDNYLFYGRYYAKKYETIADAPKKSGEKWGLRPILGNETFPYGPDGRDKEFLESVDFYWYTYFIGAFFVVGMLFNMMLAMIGRLYKIVMLYIIAPAPISQIVIDEGKKFNTWRASTMGEFLNVLGAVISFMVFIILIGAINTLDFTSIYETVPDGTTFINQGRALIVNGTGIRQNLSMFLSSSGRGAVAGPLLYVFDATMKVFLVVAGASAVKEINPLINELISGKGTNSMENAGMSKAAGDMVGAAAGVAGLIMKKHNERKEEKMEAAQESGGEGADEADAAEEVAQNIDKRGSVSGDDRAPRPDGDGGGDDGGGGAAAQVEDAEEVKGNIDENAPKEDDGGPLPDDGGPLPDDGGPLPDDGGPLPSDGGDVENDAAKNIDENASSEDKVASTTSETTSDKATEATTDKESSPEKEVEAQKVDTKSEEASSESTKSKKPNFFDKLKSKMPGFKEKLKERSARAAVKSYNALPKILRGIGKTAKGTLKLATWPIKKTLKNIASKSEFGKKMWSMAEGEGQKSTALNKKYYKIKNKSKSANAKRTTRAISKIYDHEQRVTSELEAMPLKMSISESKLGEAKENHKTAVSNREEAEGKYDAASKEHAVNKNFESNTWAAFNQAAQNKILTDQNSEANIGNYKKELEDKKINEEEFEKKKKAEEEKQTKANHAYNMSYMQNNLAREQSARSKEKLDAAQAELTKTQKVEASSKQVVQNRQKDVNDDKKQYDFLRNEEKNIKDLKFKKS